MGSIFGHHGESCRPPEEETPISRSDGGRVVTSDHGGDREGCVVASASRAREESKLDRLLQAQEKLEMLVGEKLKKLETVEEKLHKTEKEFKEEMSERVSKLELEADLMKVDH